VNKDTFANKIYTEQSELVEKFKRENPTHTMNEAVAYALGLIHMGDFAVKLHET
jgi:hypothetical protein